MENQKSYYAIIPANVRYDKDLRPNAKLLYGEITALCNEKGYCWATNSYFADLYGVSKIAISNWIKELVDKGYIQAEIIYKEGTKEILNRYLKIVYDPIKQNFNRGIKQKFKENNTYINNTYNNSSSSNNTNTNDFTEVIKFYEDNIGDLGPYQLQLLQSYEDDFTNDVIIYALQKSIDANAKNMNYTKAILDNWIKKGLKNIRDIKAEKRNQFNNEDRKKELVEYLERMESEA